jgi:hypothetical protein
MPMMARTTIQGAEEAIGAHLRHDGGHEERGGGGGFGVSVRQPGVEREDGDLDGEGEEESEEESELFGLGEGNLAGFHLEENRGQVKGAGLRIDVEDGDQHQHGAGHRIDEEFGGGVDAALAAPDADEEVHRDEDDFPEDVVEEEVERGEDADQAELEQKQIGVELFLPVNDGPLRDVGGDRDKEGRQDDKPEACAVDADVEADSGGIDPGRVRDPGHAAGALHGGADEEQRDGEDEQREAEDEALGDGRGKNQRGGEADQRQQEENGEDVHRAPPNSEKAEKMKTAPRTTQAA